ncbi:uncharacterized protein LOC125228756 [Leguminivora glycinivorella]|uniref:uncharacterized protein LOC125228756 n=1 Tax=Leguminivora glycinivorella TaxID=1035111 RepID=UPI00200CFCCE|nr:uncharacterized protein LOC125228756 [Leguminivora glycinivorella]
MNSIYKLARTFKYIQCLSPVSRIVPNSFRNGNKQVHTSQIMSIKMFMEHENLYAYSIMENNGYVAKLKSEVETVPVPKDKFNHVVQQDWYKKSPQDLFALLPTLGKYCMEHNLCISNKIFDGFIDNLTDNIKHATDEELKGLFHSLANWPETESIRTRNYIEVWAALDDECLKRHRDWSVDQMLSFLSLFYLLNVTRASDYCTKSLQRITNKVQQLTPQQLVQTMFYISANRKSPHDMHNLEVHLENNFAEFSLDELAIMSMGFFKSKTPIRNMALIEKIIDKIVEQSSNVHEVSLAALLKVIRYSMKSDENSKIYDLLETLQHEAPRLSIMCKVHIALVGTATLTLHKQCLSKIAESVINSMSQARIKDLERLVFTFGTFNHRPDTKECFFKKVTDELRTVERQAEIRRFGRSYACTVSFLGMLNIYPVDLMDNVLSPEFLLNTYGKYCQNYGKEILTIQNSRDIHYANETQMNSLPTKQITILAKKYTDFCPSETFPKQYNVSEKLFLDVKRILKEKRGGDDYVIGDHVLTHHQRGDIIICDNHDGTPLPIANVFSTASFGVLRRRPDDNKWTVIIIAGRNGEIKNTGSPTGPFLSKVRDLHVLGYHAALVSWQKYSKLQTAREKSDYLDELIKNA